MMMKIKNKTSLMGVDLFEKNTTLDEINFFLVRYFEENNQNLSNLGVSVKKIWLYKNICGVIDFSYEDIFFAFDVKPNKVFGVDVDILQRNTEHEVLIIKMQGKKKRICEMVSLMEAVDSIILTIKNLVNFIHAKRLDS